MKQMYYKKITASILFNYNNEAVQIELYSLVFLFHINTAAMIWQAFEGKDFTNEEVAKWLTEKYDIDEETALADVIEITSKWVAYGIINS